MGRELERRNRWARLLFVGLVTAVTFGCGTEPESAVPTPDPVEITAPHFPPLRIPPDNPTTRQGIALGRRLFYDPILSRTATMSCGTCHAPELAFTDHGRRVSTGVRGLDGTRNAPSLTNVGWYPAQFWDGRRATLEAQALDPVPAHDEMDLPWDEAVARLRGNASYPPLFAAAFGSSEITSDRVVKAIAQFERTFVSTTSRYDRFVQTGQGLTQSERNGYILFFTERADCFHCHVDYTFTDLAFQNNGLDSVFTDPGLYASSLDPADLGKFKTPTLRNVELTAPYMHDGRFATLEEVVEHYESGAKYSENINPFIRVNGRTLGLTAADKRDLIAFLKTLTDSAFVNDPALRPPF